MRGAGRNCGKLQKSGKAEVKKARAEIKRLRRSVRLHKMSDETAALRIEMIEASIAQAFTRQGCQRADKDDKKVVKKGVKKERRGLKMVAVEQGKSEDGAPSTPPPSRQPAKRARVSSSPTKMGGESPLKQAGRASQQASTIKFEGRVGERAVKDVNVAVEPGKSEDGALSTPPRSRRLHKKTRVSSSPPKLFPTPPCSRQPAKRARVSSSPTKLGGKAPLTKAGRASQQASTIKFEGRVEDPSTITFLRGGKHGGVLTIVWQFLPRFCSMMGAGFALDVLGRAFAAIEKTPTLPAFSSEVLALAALREATAYICVGENEVKWRKEIDELAGDLAATVRRAEACLVMLYFQNNCTYGV